MPSKLVRKRRNVNEESGMSDAMSIGQLGHHPGLHVDVNLEGKTVGGVLVEAERWVPGVVIGSGGDGTFAIVKLDTPIGGGEQHRLFRRESKGEDRVSFDDPARIRARELADVRPAGVPAEVSELVRAGKKMQAIKAYRALNGATFEQARAVIDKL
jgi:hypothetical protein